MPHCQYVFSQLMDHMPLTTFRRCVARYNGEHKVKHFSCLDQFRCLAMGFPPPLFARRARRRQRPEAEAGQVIFQTNSERRRRGGAELTAARSTSGVFVDGARLAAEGQQRQVWDSGQSGTILRTGLLSIATAVDLFSMIGALASAVRDLG
jgi:Domain of unknown function (DUF4372)